MPGARVFKKQQPMNEKILRNAKVKESGKLITVYQHRITGKWIDAHSIDDEYHHYELEFILA